MASINRDKNGNCRLQFKSLDGKRRTIRLGKITKKVSERILFHIEEIIAARTTNVPLSAPTAQWVTTLSNSMRDKLAACELIEKPKEITLGDWIDQYINGRTSLKPGTVRNLRRNASLLIEFFGSDQKLKSINRGDADEFREFLASKKFAPATIGRAIKRARQFFIAAMRRDLVTGNPFEGVNAPMQVNDNRRQYIPAETIYKAIEAAPNAEWRLIIALSRFGGLRIPSELVTLKWEDIDWANNRIRVHQPKLEHLPGGSFRVMPLFPRLRPYLEEQFELAEPGAKYVITGNRTANSNLRTQFQRILKRAMVKSWPRLFHNLRASFETDVCEEFPVHVAAEWCGNSLAVAEKHYLSTTEDHFRRAVEGQEIGPQKVTSNPTSGRTEMGGNGPKGEKGQEMQNAASALDASSCGDMRDDAFPYAPPKMTPTGLERNSVSSYSQETYSYSQVTGNARSDAHNGSLPILTSDKEALHTLFLCLEPDLRFVVRCWPNLSEDNQRAILVVVRQDILFRFHKASSQRQPKF